MMTCRCGGFLKLDLSHISEAERFGCLATAPLLWKCCLCGHARRLEQSEAAKPFARLELVETGSVA